ncbi:MAG: hypothetical protein K2X95_00465 [Flavobacteriaceae bacterium]|nr:hypothetical protein [Flavobacteriaceae bacterium]
MKKSIAFIGALFMGSIAFAQVSKNDNTNKTASRKVLDADVKDLPTDPDANVKTGEIKGEYHQKMKGEESNYLKVSDNTSKVKGAGITQKGNSSKSAADPYLKVTSEKKSAALDNPTIKVSGTQNQNTSSGNFMKITDVKGEKEK